MKFQKYTPAERLQPYVRFFVIAEYEAETAYKVFPSPGMVIGFQYRGQLSITEGNTERKLSRSGLTGISGTYKQFRNAAHTGSVLVYFTETGLVQFTNQPAHELFNLSIPLEDIFDENAVSQVEEKLAVANTDKQRIHVVGNFLLSQLKERASDRLVIEAVKLIYEHQGNIRIKELNQKLFISESPLEKRFRKVVGATPKKFASIVRFNTVLKSLHPVKSLTEICYENNFFDQAHFIKEFKQFTGDTPGNFKDLR